MFLKSSRYYGVETVTTVDSRSRSVQAIKLRRLPETSGEKTVVDNSLQLDVMSKRQYKDGAKFWHVADANTELEANELVETIGEVINVPNS